MQHNVKSLLLFIFPALIFYCLFMILPAFGGVFYSFTDWNGLRRGFEFVGLSNYIEALTDDENFLQSIGFTMKFVVTMVVLQNIIALLLAVFIESRRKTKGLFRTIFFMPNMISWIIGAFIWSFVFTKVTNIIAEQTIFGFVDQPWLGDPKFSFIAIVIVSLWIGVGYSMIIYMSALQGVPDSLKEAAVIDGANNIQMFFKVTVPMIMHAITINVFFTLQNSFKAFDQIYGLTGGGPGRATQTIALNIYEEAFSSNFRYGYADAKAVILFLFVLVITIFQLKFMKKREVQS